MMLLPSSLMKRLQAELEPQRLIPSLLAGAILGIMLISYSFSFSFLVFSGELSRFLPQYVGFSLFTSVVVALALAVSSSTKASGMVQDAPAAISGVNAIAVATALPATISDETKFVTLVALLGLTTVLTGVISWLLGQWNLGNLMQFIPYPVVGGFLAGTGWLLLAGSFKIMADFTLSWEGLSLFWNSDRVPFWSAGIAYALILLLISRRWQHWAIFPSSLIITMGLFYLGLALTQTSIPEAIEQGWLIEFPASAQGWHPLAPTAILQVDWSVIFPQFGGMVTIALLSVIAVLLNCSGLELATKSDIELNQELKMTGIANLIAGLGGGLVGYHSFSGSLLVSKIGSQSRVPYLLAGLIGMVALILGTSAISLVPKFLLGGLAAFLGLSLLAEWLYDAWFKLSLADYLNVLVILSVVIFAGFLWGVGIGIIVAIILFTIDYSRTPTIRNCLSGVSYRSRVRRLPSQERVLREKGEAISILQLQGVLFFGSASRLLKTVRDRLAENATLQFLILDFHLVNGLDSSVIINFLKLKQMAEASDFKLVFSKLSAEQQGQLEQGEVLTPADPICSVFPDLDRAMAWCEAELIRLSKLRRSRSMPLFIQLKASFPDPELVPILMQTYLIPMQLNPEEILFQKGDPYDGLYFLEAGQVSFIDGDDNLETQRRVATYNQGTLIGEQGLYQKKPRAFNAIAECKSRLYFLPTNVLAQMETHHPHLASALHRFTVQFLAQHLDDRDQEIQELLG